VDAGLVLIEFSFIHFILASREDIGTPVNGEIAEVSVDAGLVLIEFSLIHFILAFPSTVKLLNWA